MRHRKCLGGAAVRASDFRSGGRWFDSRPGRCRHLDPGWYLTGGRGDMSPSLNFGVPLTGIDSVIPGWDAFNPPHWNEFCPSVSDMNPQQRRPQTSTTVQKANQDGQRG